MPPEQKLLYLYLFTSPSTNNLGVLSVTVRKIAFETGLDEDDVREFLEDLEFDGRIVKEDGDIWVCGVIRHQCSTSPKILTSLRALLPTVESAAIREMLNHYGWDVKGKTRTAEALGISLRTLYRKMDQAHLSDK